MFRCGEIHGTIIIVIIVYFGDVCVFVSVDGATPCSNMEIWYKSNIHTHGGMLAGNWTLFLSHVMHISRELRRVPF